MKRTVILLLGGLLASSLASADLPPPDGFKFVDFALKVDASKASDYVILAYPASTSNGAPTDEYQLASDGNAVGIGRRGGIPQLYAMKRAEYDKFKAGYQPKMQAQDPALTDLFKSDRVIPCSGVTVTPSHQLPKSDPRDAVVQNVKVDSVDAKGCHLSQAADAPAPVVSAKATSPADPVTPVRTDPSPASSPPARHGCGACSMPARPSGASFALVSLCALIGLARRRHRRVFP